MENIRHIKDKIKSCMSCNEDHCPIIRERLERHVLSHHSSTGQTVSSQQMKLGRLSGTLSSKSALTMTTSNEQTSTSDLITEQLDKRTKKTMYRKRLEVIINEWAKQLPKYPNASAENLKQNIVNELIEKLNNISSEANEGYYDLKLTMEIEKFIDSLPSLSELPENESDLVNLKEILVQKICDLNNIISKEDMNGKYKKEKNETVIKIKDNAANTQQSFKNNSKYTEMQNNKTSTPYSSLSDNNESITDINLKERNGKKSVDAQVQQSFSSITPFRGNMYKNSIYKIDKHQNTDVMDNCYKLIISNWLDSLTKKLDEVEKNIITDAVLSRLEPLLNKKYRINHKLLLKAQIISCLNDYTNISISHESYNQINRISDDLAVKLLSAKLDNEKLNAISSRSYFQNSKDKILSTNFGPEDYFDPIVQNIVSKNLERLDISNIIKRDIINIIMQNIKLICMRQDHYIEALIFDILQHYTELSDYCISNIVKSILDEIRIVATSSYLQIYNSAPLIDSFKICRPSLVSVFKSEHEINKVPSRRKSSDSNFPQLTVEEKKYIDNISEMIKAWMTMLPVKDNKTVSKKNKEGMINNLAQDILDQVKLEQLVPETKLEKEKYLSFFIHRWLNRLNCFENIADAQPYTEKLIEKLRIIPVPHISKVYNKNQTLDNDREITSPLTSCNRRECFINREPIQKKSQPYDKDQSIASTLKSEAILKEFISKYIEHNYDEDNPITREVFGYILKTELQKLSTPTRKKVYGNLTNQIDNILASEKLAMELQYINIISDWFKTLPMDSSFNVTGNNQRAQYVNDLAKIIRDMEEDRLKVPPEMDYNKHLKSIVSQFVNKLPITKQYSNEMSFLIDGFIANIASLRPLEPCCVFENEKDLSLNASSIPDQNISDFIEAYIRDNSNEIAEDELKLDAWSLRIFEEVDNMASENPSALSTSQVYNRLADISVQGDDIGKRFNLELSYAKEISNWLNNLPLQPIEDKSAKDLRIKMISNLAEKMSARWHMKNIDPNNTQVDVELVDYIEKWIKELPLDRNKEIVLSLVIQQILNRMERVNAGKRTLPLIQQQPQKYMSNICKSPHPCCNRHIAQKLKTIDPGKTIVEAIENWCKNLPIQSGTENNNRNLQEEFATKIYKKIGELNKNPDYFNHNFLYLQILGEEIDSGFDNLPQSPQLQSTRQKLKQEILDIINENRNLMREKAAGVEYRQELLKTIDTSIPNPIHLQSEHSPGFNIYKNRLVEMFILENFDHAQDDVKLNYVKRLRYEIDKYFQEAQNMNALTLNKEHMFNELYSSLFSVQPPNETLIAEEVEEVKTRCEIDSWFKSLPIREATGLTELYEWDQILSMLAKRLIKMEKYEKNPDPNIHKEITKWLLKLPMVPGQEKYVNDLANDLQHRLKVTINDRKCKSRDPNMSRQDSLINKNKNKGVLGTSQVAGPSTDGMPWLNPPSSPMSEKFQNTPKRPSDLILDIVETWCQQLPLPVNTQQEKDNADLLKDNLVVKIIMKISELNANSETFENNILYDVILDDELENLLSTLPNSNELIQNKTAIKNQLKDAINSVKPLIQEEKARYEYKQELKNTVDQVLEQPPNAQPEKIALFITLRDEIIDNFVAFSFCKDDEEGQEVHKMMVQDAVDKYIVGKQKINSDEVSDSLMKGNQLLCELAKVPAPSANAILEEIHEIRMKFQITDLFKELSLTEDASKVALKNQVKSTLARRLSDFNKTSFIQNHNKVRDDMMKCLRKIQNEIDPQKVEMFIEKLETSENRRKSLISPENNINLGLPKQDAKNNYQTSYKEGQEYINNKNVEDEQWMSLLPATPRVRDPNYQDVIEFREFRKNLGEVSSPREPGQPYDRSITQSGISYTKFKEGEALSSTVINKYQPINSLANSNDKRRCLVLKQGECGSIDPSNSVIQSQGFQPIDNSINQEVGSSLKNRVSSGQPQTLESDNRQPRLTQDVGVRPDVQKTFTSPQFRNLCSHSQQQIPSQVTKKSYTYMPNDLSQSSQQSRYTPSDNQNQMFSSAPKYQSKSLLTPSQMTLQSQDAPQQSQYRPPSPFQQTTASQNIPEPCRFTSPSDTIPPMAQFSSQTPNSNSRCNKSCRRPSITLLKPPETLCNNNQDMQDDVTPITDDDETECSCTNKRRKLCRGSPVCPLHMRKQCRICNGVNPFNCSISPYRRYYHY